MFHELIWSQASFTLRVKWEFPGIHFWETLGLGSFFKVPWVWWHVERDQCLCRWWICRDEHGRRSKCRVTISLIYEGLLENSFKLHTTFKPVWHSLEYLWWGREIVNEVKLLCDPWGQEQSFKPCWAVPEWTGATVVRLCPSNTESCVYV